MLLKVIGAKVHGLGSWSNGEKVVHDVLTTAGVSWRSLNMEDGSGLSRKNLVEPRQVLALLEYMHSRPDFDVFEASLPIMGIDGTLKGRMAGTPAEGNVKAKTGTISGARALSGYMTAKNGHHLVFSMIANNYYTPTSAATEAQNQAVLEMLAP
jgi:PBP4 family serine-type D-alanyl-D-alanine carboxypeptidase